MVEMLENRVSFLEKMIEKKSFFQTNLEQNRSLQFVLNHSVVRTVHFHFHFIAMTFGHVKKHEKYNNIATTTTFP